MGIPTARQDLSQNLLLSEVCSHHGSPWVRGWGDVKEEPAMMSPCVQAAAGGKALKSTTSPRGSEFQGPEEERKLLLSKKCG